MSCSLEDRDSCRWARQLAILTDESPTQAIRTAVWERLERELRELERRKREGTASPKELQRLADRNASLTVDGLWVDPAAHLYDERGLPH